MRHIHTNFKAKFRRKDLKDKLWACARVSYIPEFNKAMEDLKALFEGAYQYMKKIDCHHWSRAYFKTQFKCDILLNNLFESFNAQILKARVKGMITINEMIRTQLMIRILKRRDAIVKCKTLHCTNIVKKLEKLKKKSWYYITL